MTDRAVAESDARPRFGDGLRFLGVDVGGTNIKSVVLEAGAEFRVVSRAECRTEGGNASEVLAQVAEIARQQRNRTAGIVGLGFCLPGAIDRIQGVAGVMPNLPGAWHGVRVQEAVAAAAGLPTVVSNDARAFTLAESRLGAARGLGVVVGVTLGTGIGGGIAINGLLHEGASGFAGELGHQILEVDGLPCGCGNRGCAETFLRSRALTEAAATATVREAFEAAARGEEPAATAIADYIRYLAVALANVHTLLCPDAFVIGGGIAAAGDQLLGPLQTRVRELITFDHPTNAHIRAAQLGSIAGAIGAAILASDQVVLERA